MPNTNDEELSGVKLSSLLDSSLNEKESVNKRLLTNLQKIKDPFSNDNSIEMNIFSKLIEKMSYSNGRQGIIGLRVRTDCKLIWDVLLSREDKAVIREAVEKLILSYASEISPPSENRNVSVLVNINNIRQEVKQELQSPDEFYDMRVKQLERRLKHAREVLREYEQIVESYRLLITRLKSILGSASVAPCSSVLAQIKRELEKW